MPQTTPPPPPAPLTAEQCRRLADAAHTHRVNATAIRDTTCMRCGAKIAEGERCAIFRERALTSHEAAHAGTLYPKRRWCVACAASAAERAGVR